VLVAGNWKLFKGPAEARAFTADLAGRLPTGVDVVVCAPYVSLPGALESGLTVYAQSVHWEPEGAYTGEISPAMLTELGVHGSLVGHSERRQHFGETDTSTARRAQAALNAGLGVIACVGETLEVREAGDMALVLKLQVEAIADAVGADDTLVLAYEPVWAIGTGRTATPEQAQAVHALLRKALRDAGAADVPVLNGGSVKAANAATLFAMPDVDGGLVGGASLDADDFLGIAAAMK
jgi:triosephosphate isomerase